MPLRKQKRRKTRNKRRRRPKNTRRRRTKNKRGRRKRKKQRGGLPPWTAANSIVNLSIIKDSIQTDNFEICGYANNNQLVFMEQGPAAPVRGMCDTNSFAYHPVKWHTHPHTSKFYPSVEDILTVIKTTNGTTTSYIFTMRGMWTITLTGQKMPPSHDLEKGGRIYETIDKFNNRLYKSSPGNQLARPKVKARGINFAPDDKILEYINNINTSLNPHIKIHLGPIP